MYYTISQIGGKFSTREQRVNEKRVHILTIFKTEMAAKYGAPHGTNQNQGISDKAESTIHSRSKRQITKPHYLSDFVTNPDKRSRSAMR